ncbi:MAG: GNAT family N-acetyltransferase [Planctomycetes bacterium]|jgi:GNAT superfamily N-acetyltransferase|nr:GNAT family N-acetyltransferase [Planctomycetota bacterium]
MNLTIRAASPSDADVICEFNRLLALETEDKHLDLAILKAGVVAMLCDPNKGRYFVAEIHPSPPTPLPQGERGARPLTPFPQGETGDIVGQLGVTVEWSDWRNGAFWWIQSVYVAKEARRQGVFRLLYENVVNEARRTPRVIGVRLYVEYDNAGAQATYRSMGMAMTGYQVMESVLDV